MTKGSAILEGWITATDAARQLGVSQQAIHWLGEHKRLGEYRLFGRVRIVRAEEVTRLAQARDEERRSSDWLSVTEAAELLGVSRYVVYRKATFVGKGETAPAVASKRSVLHDSLLVFRPDIVRLQEAEDGNEGSREGRPGTTAAEGHEAD